jgi:hypothetical protein
MSLIGGKWFMTPIKIPIRNLRSLGEDLEGVPLCVVVIIFAENALLVKTVHG